MVSPSLANPCDWEYEKCVDGAKSRKWQIGREHLAAAAMVTGESIRVDVSLGPALTLDDLNVKPIGMQNNVKLIVRLPAGPGSYPPWRNVMHYSGWEL